MNYTMNFNNDFDLFYLENEIFQEKKKRFTSLNIKTLKLNVFT